MFEVTYFIAKSYSMSYKVAATDATAARQIADEWFKIEAPNAKVKKVTVREVKE